MKNSYKLIVLILLLLLTGCTAQPLFNADFDHDRVGELPSTSPWGDPYGDSISIGTLFPGTSTRHAVSVIGDGAISGQSLRYSNIDIPSGLREVRFVSVELPDRQPRYWATWVGRLDNVSEATSPLSFDFGNLTLGLATFRIYEGQLWVRSTPDFTSGYEPVGNVAPAVKHTVIVWIDDQAGTFYIALFQQGSRTLNVGPRPLVSRSVLAERQLHIQLLFEGEGYSGASYVIDDIRILQREPEMP